MDSTITTATGNNNIDALLTLNHWMNKNITFSFTDSFLNDYENNYPDSTIHHSSFESFNAMQRNAALKWIDDYGAVSLLNPINLIHIDKQNATIRMGISTAPITAYAYYPDPSPEGGDIWIGKSLNYTIPTIGTYAFYTIGHELGHALGLKHGHEAHETRNIKMDSDRDSMEFSIMTYRSYINGPTDHVYNATGGFAQSLMMYDIAAIQHLYGASFDYNSNNSTYTFSTTTGEMFINGVGEGTPYSNHIFRTIWDGGGIDTYDFSNYATNLSINLIPGRWNDLDTDGNFQRAYLGNGHYSRAQIFNALQYQNDERSLIENAVGGSGNDIIIGNQADNIIKGGKGDDILIGSSGADRIFGGTDDDLLDGGIENNILTGGLGKDIFKFSSKNHIDTITDFRVISDTIQLENSIFTSLSRVGELSDDEFRIGTHAQDQDDYIIYNQANGNLFYDADGSDKDPGVLFAQMNSDLALTNAHFIII